MHQKRIVINVLALDYKEYAEKTQFFVKCFVILYNLSILVRACKYCQQKICELNAVLRFVGIRTTYLHILELMLNLYFILLVCYGYKQICHQ